MADMSSPAPCILYASKLSHLSYHFFCNAPRCVITFTYYNYLCITCIHNFELWHSGQKFLSIICTYFLEFVAARFNLNFSICSTFYMFVLTRIKNSYSLNCLKTQNLHSIWVWVWVLFNGISTPVGHLMPKRLFWISVIKVAVLLRCLVISCWKSCFLLEN